jgi:hypothetical protein
MIDEEQRLIHGACTNDHNYAQQIRVTDRDRPEPGAQVRQSMKGGADHADTGAQRAKISQPQARSFILIEKSLTANFSGLLFVDTNSTPLHIW